MSDYQPEVGHRVRVVLEGTVTKTAPFVGTFEVDGSHWYGSGLNGFTSVERLPDPEPEWQPGDVVLDAEGNVYTRTAAPDGDWARAIVDYDGTAGGFRYATSICLSKNPPRPLTHLVRDGKPVQA